MNPAIQALLNLDFPVLAVDGDGRVLGLSAAAGALLAVPQGLEGACLATLLEIQPEELPAWLERARQGLLVRLRLPGGVPTGRLLLRAAPLPARGKGRPAWLLALHARESPIRQRHEREILMRIASVPVSELMRETVALTREEPHRCQITGDILQMIMGYLGGRAAILLRGKGLPALTPIGQSGLDEATLDKVLACLQGEESAGMLARGVVGEGAGSGLVFTISGLDRRHPALAAIESLLPFPCREAWVDGIGGFGAALTFFDAPADPALRAFATEAYGRLGRHLESAGYSRDLYSAYQELQAAQERIIQAGRLAALGEIAAGIAHELRQPVTAINNFISNIFSQVEGGKFERMEEKLHEYRDRSRRNVERLMGIIDHLRTFSRDDSVQFVPVNLHAMMEEIRDAFFHQDRTLRLGFPVEWRLAADLPVVEMDPRRIEQVVLNLVSNAADALEGSPDPRIVVGAERAQDRVRLYVQDNGPGIPPELRKRIFDPFFTTKPPGKGTGIGLSISHGIVKGHNGEIVVSDNEGGGTTFSLLLPIQQLVRGADPAHHRTAEPGPPGAPEGAPKDGPAAAGLLARDLPGPHG